MVSERKLYEEEGIEKYVAHQIEHENEPLAPGAAFPFVKVDMESRFLFNILNVRICILRQLCT